jgi:hypothetical protein
MVLHPADDVFVVLNVVHGGRGPGLYPGVHFRREGSSLDLRPKRGVSNIPEYVTEIKTPLGKAMRSAVDPILHYQARNSFEMARIPGDEDEFVVESDRGDP